MILLAKSHEAEVGCNLSEETLISDFRRVSNLNVILRWRGGTAGLRCVAHLKNLNRLARLDLSFDDLGVNHSSYDLLRRGWGF